MNDLLLLRPSSRQPPACTSTPSPHPPPFLSPPASKPCTFPPLSEVTGNRFSGAIPAVPWRNLPSNVAANPLLLLGANYFSSFSPEFSSSVCNSSDVQGSAYLHYNCLPDSTSDYCYTAPGSKTSQPQRNFNTCSVACASACPGGSACYLMGDSFVPACPCDAASYPSFAVPGACLPFRSEWGLVLGAIACCWASKWLAGLLFQELLAEEHMFTDH